MLINAKYIDGSVKVIKANSNMSAIDNVKDYVSIEKYDLREKELVDGKPKVIYNKIDIGERSIDQSISVELSEEVYGSIISLIEKNLPVEATQVTWIEMKSLFFDEIGNLLHNESYFQKLITVNGKEEALDEIKSNLQNLFGISKQM